MQLPQTSAYLMHVIKPLMRSCKAWWSYCGQAVAGAWRMAPPVLCHAPHSLDIPLTPAPAGQWASRLFLVAQLLYAAQLLLLAHPVTALLIFVLATAFWRLQRRAARFRGNSPRRLLITADGRLHILTIDGSAQQVTLHPASLRLGPWLLLVLRAETRLIRLLLGPDNLHPAQLAALKRRMGTLRMPGPLL